MKSQYFETSEADDVLGSLQHLKRCLSDAKSDPQLWKWVVLSLFGAVQGSIVCHAAGSTQIEVLTTASAKETLSWLEQTVGERGAHPTKKLAGPDTLYKRLNGTFTDFAPAGGVIRTRPDQDCSFRYIKNLRDDFSHFTPRGWSIDIKDIREKIPPLLDLIEEIRAKGHAFRHGRPSDIEACLSAIRAQLKE